MEFPGKFESTCQRILVGIILVGRLDVARGTELASADEAGVFAGIPAGTDSAASDRARRYPCHGQPVSKAAKSRRTSESRIPELCQSHHKTSKGSKPRGLDTLFWTGPWKPVEGEEPQAHGAVDN